MRYVMIITGDESNWFGDDAPADLMDQVNTWWEKWYEAGRIAKGGAELAPANTAKTIGRSPDGRPTVTDGPYLELKEVVGGFIILVTDTIDDAVNVAAGWPGIPLGDRVEVRPVMER
ncbi:YciI family protein [Winogradskya humida]|uniref:Transcription initiation protein n=1 Tax=Winogradskya humida TaxID=113566 RepID=A0ABQ3ZHX9_9ACTN|nr:YciI family protein [Actinoplanes humidus]GIE18152.1 transcription initiation protein [Actinoplanes humidus]